MGNVTSNSLAGSGMTTSAPSSTSLGRHVLLAICGVLCISLLGAAQPAPAKLASDKLNMSIIAPLVQETSIVDKATAELMHDIPVAEEPTENDAMLASALIPAAKPRQHHMWMQVTAYCACKKCCGPKARGLTASGLPISYNGGHFVAADGKLFKFGTQLIVPGYADGQPVEVIDRGGAIKGHHIDLYFPSHEQAKQWGRKWVQVTVIE